MQFINTSGAIQNIKQFTTILFSLKIVKENPHVLVIFEQTTVEDGVILLD